MIDLITYALLRKQISEAVVQADWDQTNELATDFIKNKPDESDAIELIMETGLAEPLFADDNTVLADEQSIFVL